MTDHSCIARLLRVVFLIALPLAFLRGAAPAVSLPRPITHAFEVRAVEHSPGPIAALALPFGARRRTRSGMRAPSTRSGTWRLPLRPRRPRSASLRWSASSRRPGSTRPPSKPPARPPSGGSGGPPSSHPGALSPEDAAWLATLTPWARTVASRMGLRGADVEDAVQDAFVQAVQRWAAFHGSPDVPERFARRSWIGAIVARVSGHARDRARLAAKCAARAHEARTETVESHEGPVSARATLRSLEAATTPERWRVWLAYEVDETAVDEIARTEGIPPASVYNRIRLARLDLAAALAREDAAAVGPLVVRHERKGKA